MATTGELFFKFHKYLKPSLHLPDHVSVINPFGDKRAVNALQTFCNKFYNNSKQRTLLLGINPGRFGAGVTGVPFTDPVNLEEECGIENDFDKRAELSSRFVYEVIHEYGGIKKFYNHFLLSSVCPLGFLKGPKNYNYYDSPELIQSTGKFISDSLKLHAQFNIATNKVISFGVKNATHLEKINRELQLFNDVIPLDHPRFIMQYKSKLKNKYIDSYLKVLHRT